MCGIKSKKLSTLCLLLSLSFSARFISYSYADVTLTDKEAQELMSEIQESKKDLSDVKSQLNEAETQLSDVKKDSAEQKTYYEKQLKEAEKENKSLRYTACAEATAIAILSAILLFIFL